ncbi:hypothetical protein JVW24_22060, partial [Vibrio cholerae O1]|nr:hypothetical protein [Vibrio cholerae O1]
MRTELFEGEAKEYSYKTGANTFRFNFSHGDHQEQGERMATVKLAEKIAGKKVGFLLDTKGPEIRTE